MRVIWRTAMSMDGRIATADESLAFLDSIADQDAAVSGFPEFMRSIDAIILGAGTLRWLLRGGHGWPHGDVATWLVSHDATLEEQVGHTEKLFRRAAGALEPMLEAMEGAGYERVWLAGGGDLAGQLLALDRIDEVDVTIAPVALGAGPGLFGAAVLPPHRFELADVRRVAGNAIAVKWVGQGDDPTLRGAR